jgi:hypothetical protein
VTAPAYGYLSIPIHVLAAGELDELLISGTRELAGLAGRHGHVLAGVFTDAQRHTEQGLYRLLDALRRSGVVAVVVPDLSHLRHAGCLAGADERTMARYLRARVLTFDTPVLVPADARDAGTGPACRGGQAGRGPRRDGAVTHPMAEDSPRDSDSHVQTQRPALVNCAAPPDVKAGDLDPRVREATHGARLLDK